MTLKFLYEYILNRRG